MRGPGWSQPDVSLRAAKRPTGILSLGPTASPTLTRWEPDPPGLPVQGHAAVRGALGSRQPMCPTTVSSLTEKRAFLNSEGSDKKRSCRAPLGHCASVPLAGASDRPLLVPL